MSLFESGESSGEISLEDLFNGKTEMFGKSKVSLEQIAFVLNRGGWPAAVNEGNEKIAIKKALDYYEAVVNEDISSVDSVKKSPDRVRSLMRSLSRNISSEANTSTILGDMRAYDESLSQVTIDQYINALQLLFVIDDLPAWSPSLRSKTAIRTTAKRHFSDPSIAAAALGATPDRLFNDFRTFGLLFEALCIHDLRVYADSLGGNIYHYRDALGKEVDAIIQIPDGRWGVVEVKMGSGDIETAAENLLKFKANIDTERMNEPSFLMVLTATETAFQMKNDVWVIPLGCLKD